MEENAESIYSNYEAETFHQLCMSGDILGNVRPSSGFHEVAYSSDESDFSDSSYPEADVEEEDLSEDRYVERQPVQDANGQDYHIRSRAPFPTPRNQSKGNDEMFDDPQHMYLEPNEIARRPLPTPDDPQDMYLEPNEVAWRPLPTPGPPGLPDKGFPRNQPSPPPPPKLPFGNKGPKTPRNENFKPGGPQTPPQRHKSNWSSSLGSNSPASASENGSGGAIGSSFLHQHHQENKNATLPNIPKARTGWTAPPSQAPKIPAPAVPGWSPARPPPRIPNQDFDDLSSRLGNTTLSRKHSGGTDSGSENPPNEFAPSLPYVSLDDDKRLQLTPLYQKLMEKSYFHLISRSKAKSLIMRGQDGMFLIRPSTRSGDPLTLVLNVGNQLYNINIRQRPDSLFALGKEKMQEKAFSSLDELVSTYKREAIKLENGKTAFLNCSPPKSVPLVSPTGVRK